MNGIYHRIRGAAGDAWRRLQGAVRLDGPDRRVRVAAALTAAVALAIGAGVVWGLAGTGDGRPGTAGGAGAFPGEVAPTGEVIEPGVDGVAPPGTAGGVAGNSSGSGSGGFGSGATGGGASGGGGSGSGQAGDGTGANRPPVIEDLGRASEGMLLRVVPTVSDPDGDDVSLRFEVDGEEVQGMNPARVEVRFDPTEVGYRPEVPVRVIATDGRGGVTEEEFTETLAAVSTVTFSQFEFTVVNPQRCFAEAAAWRLTGSLQLYGTVRHTQNVNVELRADAPSATVLAGRSGEVIGAAPSDARVFLLAAEMRDANGKLAGPRDAMTSTHKRSEDVRHALFTSGTCQGELTYSVNVQTR